jgi:hypothetical protein
MPKHRRRRARQSSTSVVHEVLAHRLQRVDNPSAGAPKVEYEGNPWVPYADLVDVFAPPELDEQGNVIRDQKPRELGEDPRTVKGSADVLAALPAADVPAEAEVTV